ncbi:MAG: helix-turn-helix domain-containing protein [Shinella sp.]|uniref:helix-turn-helix domain-containing protein n=1 Tax=Shinella sp. TaxID=1870904 RepID=UPI0040367C8B
MTPTAQGSEFAQLQTFVTVAGLLSFSRTVERLGITPAGEALLLSLRPAMDEISATLGTFSRSYPEITVGVTVDDAGISFAQNRETKSEATSGRILRIRMGFCCSIAALEEFNGMRKRRPGVGVIRSPSGASSRC